MQQGLSGPDGFGVRHLSPDKNRRAKVVGYGNGEELIKDVAQNHDIALEQVNGRLMLVKKDRQNRYAIAEYRNGGLERFIGKGNPYYGVTTGYPDQPNAIGKPHRTALYKEKQKRSGKILWEK